MTRKKVRSVIIAAGRNEALLSKGQDDLPVLGDLRTVKSLPKSVQHRHAALRFDEMPF
jgi:hypothetical protein